MAAPVAAGEGGNRSGRECPVLNGWAIAPQAGRSGRWIYAQAHIVQVAPASEHAVCTRRAPD